MKRGKSCLEHLNNTRVFIWWNGDGEIKSQWKQIMDERKCYIMIKLHVHTTVDYFFLKWTNKIHHNNLRGGGGGWVLIEFSFSSLVIVPFFYITTTTNRLLTQQHIWSSDLPLCRQHFSVLSLFLIPYFISTKLSTLKNNHSPSKQPVTTFDYIWSLDNLQTKKWFNCLVWERMCFVLVHATLKYKLHSFITGLV